MIEDVKTQLLHAVLEADRSAADTLLNDWAEHSDYASTVVDVLEPVLEKIGLIWEKSRNISLAQAYVAGKIAEDFLTKVRDKVQADAVPAKKKGIIVIGNIEDDYHSLGRKMVSIFLKTYGWDIVDLGNDVIAEDFVDKAVELNSQFIAISAMMYSNAMNIKKVRAELEKRNLSGKIKLIVGGAVFVLRPELVNEVGADATAANAIKAPALFDSLLARN